MEQRVPEAPHPLSIHQAFRFAWATFKPRTLLFIAALLTFVGAWIVLEIIVIAGQPLGPVVWVLAHVAFLLVFGGLEVGLLQMSLALHEGQEPTYAGLFRHLARGPVFLIGQLVYLLLVVAGLVFFVVPGIYLAGRYSLFGFGLLTPETDLIRSFQQSAMITTGRQGSLLTILAILVVFNVLGACLLGLGLLLTVPLSVLTMTAVYRQLSDSATVRDSLKESRAVSGLTE